MEQPIIQPVGTGIVDDTGKRSIGFAITREASLFRSAMLAIKPHETLVLLFAALFSFVSIATAERVTEWPQVVLRMSAVVLAVLLINVWATWKNGKFSLLLKVFYVVVLPPVFFKTAEFISFPLHGHDFDSLFIIADRMLCFGVNPTWWLYQHIPIVPAFIEYLQICYSLFYFLPLSLAIELYHKEGAHSDRLQEVFFAILYGFLLSYVAYFFFPSIGPRFTLHDFMATSRELPGIFATDWLRAFLDRGENILPGMPLPTILRVVTRDAFPSGHAEVTLLTILLAFKFRARTRWPIAILGSSLIFSTVYLRYHYVVDILAGAVLAMVVLYSSEWLSRQMVVLREKIV